MSVHRIKLWDLPTRLFHWLLVGLVVAAFVSGLIGGNAIVWHGRFGVAIAGLLAFRLVWGFIGSSSARFAHFMPTPARIRDYLQGRWSGLGHNPLGALSVFGLLAVLLFQVGSGLVSNDDIAFSGPLRDWVSEELSQQLTSLHRQSIWLVGGLVALHVAAILFYAHVKKDNLVKPMISGYKELDAPPAEEIRPARPWALIVALALAAAVTWLAAGGLVAEPPPPPPASTPAW